MMAQSPKGGNCGTRVRSLDRRSMQIGPPIRGRACEAQRRQAVRPRVLIIVLIHCKRASLLVLRKEQGDDAAEDQSGDALATGDLHQVQDCESTVTEDRAAEPRVQPAFGANFVKSPMVVPR